MRRRWRAGLVAAAVVVDLVGGGLLVARNLGTPAGWPPHLNATSSHVASHGRAASEALTALSRRTSAVQDVLNRRAAAVNVHSRAGWLATVDPQDPAFQQAQAAAFDQMQPVPFTSYSLTLQPDQSFVLPAQAAARYGAAPTWTASVLLHYALPGVDPVPTARVLYATFVQRGSAWYLGGLDDLDATGRHSAKEPWDFGPVTVLQGAHSLVVGHAPAGLAAIQRRVETAVPKVTGVWGTDWAQRVAVFVPSTQAELARLVDDGSDFSALAAVATAQPDGSGLVGDRVLINPATWQTLSPLGRDVVLAHEITHVATRAYTGPLTPDWLVEGAADYVGYLGTGLRTGRIVRELAADVQAGRVPAALPDDDAFKSTNPALAQAYEEAWLACRLIAERAGQAGLVRFYREVGTAQPAAGTLPTPEQSAQAVDSALRSVLGMSTAQFTAAWHAVVVGLR